VWEVSEDRSGNLGLACREKDEGMMNGMHSISVPIEEKLRNYIERAGPLTTKCWIWQGSVDKDGYGLLTWYEGDQKHQRAHRASWVFHNGEIPDELLALHHCDNPSCINPDHIYIGSPQDNMDDKWARGRHIPLVGEDHPLCKLSETDIALIRYFLTQGYGVNSLAKRYRVTHAAIQHIRDWKSWKHVEAFRPVDGQPLPVPPPLPYSGPPVLGLCKEPPKFNNTASRFKGVQRDGKRWYAQISLPGGPKGKTTWLGYFNTEVEAAIAHNNAIVHYGLERPLNVIDEAGNAEQIK
jgi:hypothetical protein